MSYQNNESPLVLKTENDDTYFYIDNYEDPSTDPSLSILVEFINDELMESSKPINQESKYYAIENGEELSTEEAADRMDFYIKETTTNYMTNTHDLTYLERETECGASGATELVVLAIFSGAVGGVASSITSKLIEIYGKAKITLSADEIHTLIRNLLKESYNAKGEILCTSAKKNGNERKFTFEDESMSKYYVQFIDNEGVKSIRVKRT